MFRTFQHYEDVVGHVATGLLEDPATRGVSPIDLYEGVAWKLRMACDEDEDATGEVVTLAHAIALGLLCKSYALTEGTMFRDQVVAALRDGHEFKAADALLGKLAGVRTQFDDIRTAVANKRAIAATGARATHAISATVH